jgi:hypothetical protein
MRGFRKWKGTALGGGNGDRGDYLNSIKKRLRGFFPHGVEHAAEKRADFS